jgi:hypothetical protein
MNPNAGGVSTGLQPGTSAIQKTVMEAGSAAGPALEPQFLGGRSSDPAPHDSQAVPEEVPPPDLSLVLQAPEPCLAPGVLAAHTSVAPARGGDASTPAPALESIVTLEVHSDSEDLSLVLPAPALQSHVALEVHAEAPSEVLSEPCVALEVLAAGAPARGGDASAPAPALQSHVAFGVQVEAPSEVLLEPLSWTADFSDSLLTPRSAAPTDPDGSASAPVRESLHVAPDSISAAHPVALAGAPSGARSGEAAHDLWNMPLSLVFNVSDADSDAGGPRMLNQLGVEKQPGNMFQSELWYMVTW